MINSIYIKNFRSIKELEIFPENLCTLPGPNSVGKTNILKAIDLVLGEGWATKAKVARELFNDPQQPIEIEIKFKTAAYRAVLRYGLKYKRARPTSIQRKMLIQGLVSGE